jgi:hypothetical protein
MIADPNGCLRPWARPFIVGKMVTITDALGGEERFAGPMPVNQETLLPLLDPNEDDPVAWSLRLQALAELRALSEDLERPGRTVRLT